MKYLKFFEEVSILRVDRDLECSELTEFCKLHLSYLVDMGFFLDIKPDKDNDRYIINIINHDRNFKYEEVVDDFISFLQILNTQYLLRSSDYLFQKPTDKSIYFYKPIPGTGGIIRTRILTAELPDVIKDDKSNEVISTIYDSDLCVIKLSVIPRKWLRHIDPKLLYSTMKNPSMNL